jgi:hypothetical protein
MVILFQYLQRSTPLSPSNVDSRLSFHSWLSYFWLERVSGCAYRALIAGFLCPVSVDAGNRLGIQAQCFILSLLPGLLSEGSHPWHL